MTLDFRKYRLIKFIIWLTDELLVRKLEAFVEPEKEENHLLNSLQKPIREGLDLEALMSEQNFASTTQKELEQIMQDAAIEEPIEELIQMI